MKLQSMFSLVGIIFLAMVGVVSAAEIPDGTVITAQNIDQYMGDTFEGHTLKDMLTDRMEWMIREQGFKPKLIHSSKVKMDPKWVAATKKYHDQVKFDPKTREVSGYVAGVPFPNVKESDPNAAIKLIWNYYYGAPHADYQHYTRYAYLQISPKGVQKQQRWTFKRYYLKGLLHYKGGHTRGDGDLLMKTLLLNHYPLDVRGLGTFSLFPDNGDFPKTWAYIPAVRRIRQLSGSAWMNPIGGSDQLISDLEIVNIYPTWFPKYKLVGQRWILASVHGKWGWNPDGDTLAETYPGIDVANKPHWNPKNVFEPRKVWVIDAYPPENHPYGRIRLYEDQAYPRFNMADVYDHKGKFWKEEIYSTKSISGPDGAQGVVSTTGFTIDYQKRHATVFLLRPDSAINTPGVTPQDVNLGLLRSGG